MAAHLCKGHQALGLGIEGQVLGFEGQVIGLEGQVIGPEGQPWRLKIIKRQTGLCMAVSRRSGPLGEGLAYGL